MIFLYPSFSENRKIMEKYSPLIQEAKKQNIGYDDVIKDSEKYKGEFVIWCVQNLNNGEVFYKGNIMKRILISNYNEMPHYLSSKHSNCSNTLLMINSSKKTSTGSYIIEAEYIFKIN